MRSLLNALAICLTLAACGGEVVEDSECPDDGTKSTVGEQFSAQYAESYCDLRKDCYPDAFDDEFGNIETCQKAVSKREVQQDCAGCVLDSEIADECVQAAKTISCSDWVDDGALEEICDGRWDCSDEK